MKKRGLIIALVGLTMVGISFSIAISVIPSNVDGPDDISLPSMLEEMFDEISDEIQIMPGSSAFISYGTPFSDVSLLWGIQIIDYQYGDELFIQISNIFGDNYGEFSQTESILFEVLEVSQSDTLNFEIKNYGSRSIYVVVMFSEDPENSDTFSDLDSPTMSLVLPLVISGFLLFSGIIVSIIGIIVLLVDLKNNKDDKRNY